MIPLSLAAAFTWRPVAPELLLLASILILPLVGLGLRSIGGKRDLGRLTALIFAGAIAMVALMVWTGRYLGHEVLIAGESTLYEVTAFSQLLKMVFLVVGLVIALASIEYARSFRNPIEYYTLLLTGVLGMMVVASARDLITLFIGLETTSLSSYILVGYAKDKHDSVEASTKYFVIGALSSAVFLYGISLLYGIAGTLRFDEMATALGTGGMDAITLVAIVLVLVGIGFKVSMAPFHMWAPDVYQGAPSPVGGFLSAGSKAMGFTAAFKVFLVGLAAVKADWDILVAILAVASMTIGNIIALRQTNLKRLLAYSSIAQAGYILIALVVATEYALAGGVYHVVTEAIMKGTAFIAIAAVAAYGLGEEIEDYRGMRLRSPLVAAALAIMLLSLAGVPPLGGFVSKFALFSSAIYASFDDGRSWLLWLAVAGIVNSLISLFYYARIVRYIYGEPGSETTRMPLTLGTTIAIGFGIVAIIVLGVWPDLVWTKAMDAAASLLGPVAAGP